MKRKSAHSTRKRTTTRPAVSHRVRPAFRPTDDAPVEETFTFWIIHASHWCVLLIAIIGMIVIGMDLFSSTGGALAFGP